MLSSGRAMRAYQASSALCVFPFHSLCSLCSYRREQNRLAVRALLVGGGGVGCSALSSELGK